MTIEMQGIKKVERAVGRWAPSDLAFVEQLDFQADGSVVTIVALFQPRGMDSWPDVDAPMRRVKLQFRGVNGLRLRGFGGGPKQVMGFAIDAISERGLENANFKVEDYEDGSIEFTCSSAEVVDVEEADVFLP